MFKWIQAIKEILNYVKVMAENLQAINKALDVCTESQGDLIDQGNAIMTHLITDREKEETIRFYGPFLGKHMFIKTKDNKVFNCKVVKCGVVETFELSDGNVVKTIKPFIAGENGEILFAYADDIVALREGDTING